MSTENIEGSMMSMMMVVLMAGIMMSIIPQPEPQPEPPPEPVGYGCPYCDLKFDTMAELAAHIEEAHPDMPPFVEVDIGWQ